MERAYKQEERAIDATVIAGLLIAHRTGLMAYIRACLRSHAEAEDVFQEVCLVATRSAGKLRNERGFLPWAREISRRLTLEYRRKSSRMTPLDPELLRLMADAAVAVEDEIPIKMRSTALQLCLQALPEVHRQILAQRYDDRGYAVEQIARQHGRSVQATYAILKRSRQLLRECVTMKLRQEGMA